MLSVQAITSLKTQKAIVPSHLSTVDPISLAHLGTPIMLSLFVCFCEHHNTFFMGELKTLLIDTHKSIMSSLPPYNTV